MKKTLKIRDNMTTAICDASYCPKTQAAGWAIWLRMGRAERPYKKAGTFKHKPISSYQAEYWACLNAVRFALRNSPDFILIQNDNQQVIHNLTKGTPALDRIMKKVIWPLTIRFRWVPGHTKGNTPRTWVNNWCDEQAKKKMYKLREQIQNDNKESRNF